MMDIDVVAMVIFIVSYMKRISLIIMVYVDVVAMLDIVDINTDVDAVAMLGIYISGHSMWNTIMH